MTSIIEKKRLKIFFLAFAVFFSLTLSIDAYPAEDLPSLERFGEQIETLVRQYYPQVQVSITPEKITFSYETMDFMIHLPLMTGEWQSATRMEGPKRDIGILGTISLDKGVWGGQAMVPQTLDYHYFSGLLMAPYSSYYKNRWRSNRMEFRIGDYAEIIKKVE